MKQFLFLVCLLISLTAASQTYYIVRHGEKAVVEPGSNMMASDPPLSEAGVARANRLRELLKGEKIDYVFSTDKIRTRTTAEPTSKQFNVTIQSYSPQPDAAFIDKLKALKGNVLIVGHSNTIDDVVNMLLGEQKLTDLPETEYDNLFIVTIKNGTATFERRKF